ncbi:hypothetical protein M3P21_05010 [Ruegeria sp. 2012CJ41-6]|uniref:Uncharacterized protein n=1 Tax=Ruegeria spongiae TaxID=2942209 RepID=A0ABT0PZ42_9RHOB|nr:hypothetical protein [Ruegeria spongiae]MCL6282886.1 hypothetical protein [Ruegeria spongiae]
MPTTVWEIVSTWAAEGTFLKHLAISGVSLIFVGLTYAGQAAASMSADQDGNVPVVSVTENPLKTFDKSFGVTYRTHHVSEGSYNSAMKFLRIPLLGLLIVGVVGMAISGIQTIL